MAIKNIICLLMLTIISISGLTQENIQKKCPRCGHIETQQQAKYCVYCGSKLQLVKTMPVRICPGCKKIIEEKGANYCPFCGKKVIISYQEIPGTTYDPTPTITPTPTPSPLPAGKKTAKNLLAGILPPSCTALEKQVIDEGLRLTSRQRQIQQALYSCAYSYEQIEDFYRRHPLKPPIMKFGDPILRTTMLILKFNDKDQKIELAIYTPGKNGNQERVQQQIQDKMLQELRVSRRYQKEIDALQKLIAAGKVTQRQVQSRLDDLERRRQMSTNSRTYWQLKARERACQLRQNIFLLTIVTKR